MDDVLELCRRVLGDGPLAEEAVQRARAEARRSRITRLSAASRACRELAERAPVVEADGSAAPSDVSLVEAVSAEVSRAGGRLPELQREALVLREVLRLSHREMARVMETRPKAVALLLAQARLALRAERRGPLPETPAPCGEGERALGLLARHQDGEEVSAADREWLLAHMAECRECEIAHAAMLEASACYRAWPVREAAPSALVA